MLNIYIYIYSFVTSIIFIIYFGFTLLKITNIVRGNFAIVIHLFFIFSKYPPSTFLLGSIFKIYLLLPKYSLANPLVY